MSQPKGGFVTSSQERGLFKLLAPLRKDLPELARRVVMITIMIGCGIIIGATVHQILFASISALATILGGAVGCVVGILFFRPEEEKIIK